MYVLLNSSTLTFPSIFRVVDVLLCSNFNLCLGIVFLVFRNRTESGLLPNEITSINTVWALFVRAFPKILSMSWFETAIWTIWILDTHASVYRILQDLR
jgi:hypothetical protein